MLNIIENKIKGLTDVQLEECYNDIISYNKLGFMGDTLTRKIRDEIAKDMNDEKWDRSCTIVIIPEILLEIANRHYKEKEKFQYMMDVE